MTVKELKKLLEKFPEEMDVVAAGEYPYPILGARDGEYWVRNKKRKAIILHG